MESQKSMTVTTDYIDTSTSKKVKTNKSSVPDNFEIEVRSALKYYINYS